MRVAVLGHRVTAILHLRARDLADIDGARRIDGDAVRRDELARPALAREIADARQKLALVRHDAEARPDARHLLIDLAAGPELADVAHRFRGIGHAEAAGAVDVVPLRLVAALAVEHLDAVVLAVGDIDPAIGVGDDVVHDVELAGPGAGLAPGEEQLAVVRVFVHARIAIAVGDIDLLLRRERGVGAAVEGSAADIGRGLARHAELQEQRALEGELAHGVVAVIGAVDRVVGPDMDAMRAHEQPFAPAAQEIAVAVEHDHRMGAAIEDIDAVLAVDGDAGDFAVSPALGKLAPALDDAIAIIAAAQHLRHDPLPSHLT